jgi:hypothetical protein
MRSDTVDSASPHCNRQESPKASSVWSTERRLLERPPPDAPRKLRRSHSLLHRSEQDDCETSTKRQRNNRLLLPSRTIDEEIDSPNVSLHFRPTNLTALFGDANRTIVSPINKDPTTVLLVPESSSLQWYEEVENNDDDMILSPRLFRFGRRDLLLLEEIDLAEDGISSSHDIFRYCGSDNDSNVDEEVESREFTSVDFMQHRLSWTMKVNKSEDDDRL